MLCGIVMILFGILTCLYGFYVYKYEFSFLPFFGNREITEEYRMFMGQTIMLVSLSAVLGGIVALFGNAMIIWAFVVMLVAYIAFFALSVFILQRK